MPEGGVVMSSVQLRPRTPSVQPASHTDTARRAASLPTWRVNVMRVGYLVMGVGLAITK